MISKVKMQENIKNTERLKFQFLPYQFILHADADVDADADADAGGIAIAL